MKIAVYGDSYSVEYHNPKNLNPWVSIIRQQEKNFEIDNFSQSGSSFYFSITKFLENHFLYDKVIFIITHPGRLFVPNNEEFPHVSGIVNCDLRIESSNKISEKVILESARNYLRDVQNTDEEIFKHHCMFEKIGRIRTSNILFIPVNSLSIPGYNGTVLTDISNIDIDYYKNDTFATRADLRCCHMNQPNNEILANKVSSWLNGGDFTLDINHFKPPIEKENEIWDKTYYL